MVVNKVIVSIVFILLFAGWGPLSHRIMNSKITECFPPTMNFPAYWNDTLTIHSSDPDNRKGTDPGETPKHFIIIDCYPEFITNGYISQSYDTNVNLHGSTFVITEGTLPWAIQWTVDSIRTAFEKRNWNKAMLLSADLGHYIADGHLPFHVSQNYNGQLTNQTGAALRVDTLVGRYKDSIRYSNVNASYVSDISGYVFDFLYQSNSDLFYVLYCDSLAHALVGSTTGNIFPQVYWYLCGSQIIRFMKSASKSAADLIYTAWIDAGSPDPNATSVNGKEETYSTFSLEQNYPNPFNPTSTITYQLPKDGFITLKVYDNLGRENACLVNEYRNKGKYNVTFDASKLPSGIYIYQLRTNDYFSSKKMILLK